MCTCGLPNKPSKIFGGEEALPHEYPWNVFVTMNGMVCGGSLISNQHVLTAGHCVDASQPGDVQLHLGRVHCH